MTSFEICKNSPSPFSHSLNPGMKMEVPPGRCQHSLPLVPSRTSEAEPGMDEERCVRTCGRAARQC